MCLVLDVLLFADLCRFLRLALLTFGIQYLSLLLGKLGELGSQYSYPLDLYYFSTLQNFEIPKWHSAVRQVHGLILVPAHTNGLAKYVRLRTIGITIISQEQ